MFRGRTTALLGALVIGAGWAVPARAIAVSAPPATPASAANALVTLTGVLKLSPYSGAGRRNETFVLQPTSGAPVELDAYGKGLGHSPQVDALTGKVVDVRGVWHGTGFAVEGLALDTTSAAPATMRAAATAAATTKQIPAPLAPTKVAIVLVSFADAPAHPVNPDEWRAGVFTGPTSLNRYLGEVTRGAVSLHGVERSDGDVFGPYLLPAPASSALCSIGQYATDVDAAMSATGHDPANYDIIAVSLPMGMKCAWGGLAGIHTFFNWPSPGQAILQHEFGHDYGLSHAGSLTCVDPNNDQIALGGTCTQQTYGDPVDPMGSGLNAYDAFNLRALGILPAPSMRDVTTTASYSLYAQENTTSGLQQILRIPRRRALNGTILDWYYLSLRKSSGIFDQFPANDPFVTGVAIRIGGATNYLSPGNEDRTTIIDTTPATPTFSDAPLAVGKTFSDPALGVTITTAAVVNGAATVAIKIGPPTPPTAKVVNHVLTYVDAPGLPSIVDFNQTAAAAVVVSDSWPLKLGTGCKRLNGIVTCTGVWNISADMGDMDDQATVEGAIPAHLMGRAGKDILSGGMGSDTLDGGSGDDTLLTTSTTGGPDGGDTYIGGTGEDTVDYSLRTDKLNVTVGVNSHDDGAGGEGDDVQGDIEDINSGSGNDTLIGNALDNKLFGNAGSDFIEGGAGNDVLDGGLDGLGHDVNIISYGDHTSGVTVDVNPGVASGSAGEADSLNWATIVIGTPYDDTFRLDPENLFPIHYLGGAGNDTFLHPTHNVWFGTNQFSGGPGVDTVSYAGRTDAIHAAIGTAGNGDDYQENDTIDADIENLVGGDGDDALTGNSANNGLRGGKGGDTLVGGGGSDVADSSDHAQAITAHLDGQRDSGGVEDGAGDLVASDIESVVGGTGRNSLFGNGGPNVLWSFTAPGASIQPSVLDGGGGRDVLVGSNARDVIVAEGGPSTIIALAGDDTIVVLNRAADSVSCGAGFDNVTVDTGPVIDTINPDCETRFS